MAQLAIAGLTSLSTISESLKSALKWSLPGRVTFLSEGYQIFLYLKFDPRDKIKTKQNKLKIILCLTT